MRKLFTIFAALIIVSVQVIDLAVLDAAHASQDVAHAAEGAHGDDPEPCDSDGEADCAVHCPCHALHHAFARIQAADVRLADSVTAVQTIRQDLRTGLASRPPTPPPLA